ncbi:hypothetical protein CRUP_015244, partial [Coryphaenoides rupestris]
FVGLFNLLLLWPGFLVLHFTGFESFELPSQLVWTYILVNGLIGTVLSEFLWLWGCFLTSSLVGTLALSLTIPLSILADICMQKARFSWLFFMGAVPVFLSFFIATLLCHYNNWDPVMVGLRRLFAFICRKPRIHRLPEDGLFTLILAAIFPSNSSDRFTLSKLLAVALSMGGIALVSLSSMDNPDGNGIIGSLWSLAGAALYAVYIVMIKRRVDREDKLDIPMFFGW